jgi:GT2 family glycosyltransferase/SAM-dependent methyltransferase
MLQFSTIITDKLPASALLGQNNQIVTDFTPQGNLPVPLTPGECLRFHLVPTSEEITGLRLRFATYCRINHCHLTLEITAQTNCLVRFNANRLTDNQYTDLTLPIPQPCTSGQAVEISIYSDDATDSHVVALWCSRKLPVFINTLELKPLSLPAETSPRVSIVIPVFNKALYTYNCLLTLSACDPEIRKEVIIINNASSDETADLLAQLQGAFKVINNPENLGFVHACRQGGAIASGEFILFLNNDTQVTPGWLSNLLKIMDADPKIGITGSKLIYPDGYLQEAGGIIFSDASGWNYGRGQDPTDPRFDQSREVDYCSGASLMIRTILWHQLGGFDMRFAPAYYEDTDLCFAARQAGYKVFYCHNSEVIHHEGITAGTDLTQGHKAYQVLNKEKFVEKWQETLATHCPPGTAAEQAALRLTQPRSPQDYSSRLSKEIDNFKQLENVHELPDIFHYWSNKYLLPKLLQFGFASFTEFYCLYMQRLCQAFSQETCHFISIGAGNCDIEAMLVKTLLEKGINNFSLECLDLNQQMLDRGLGLAQQKNIAPFMQFTCTDMNGWQSQQKYHLVLANQSLHHFVELELLFDKIDEVLYPQGYFLSHDMIGRNGHQRWPEALQKVNELWATLPARYKYNQLLKRFEGEYDNWDCSIESFEGIRAQDILPLLVQKFNFEFFLAYGNVVDIFIDRCFGHNFDADDPVDRAFIDKVHQIDEAAIEQGLIKPTHLTAVMTKKPFQPSPPQIYKHLTPEFCIRWP